MKKKIISIALFLFVAASVTKLVLNETNKGEDAGGAATEAAATIDGTKTVVYYFHGKVRCKTCNAIEANTRKAIEAGFPGQLESGDVVMQVLNMEEPENKPYVTKYELANSSVVVSHVKDGKEVNWARLDKVWDLVGSDDAFMAYIQQETRTLMKGEE
ncbi:MAG: hypothetical protein H7A51_10010 [Akkermansiaceae bacterium]|nr:hypothetical protein [Akkermansiaceae bacterium]